MRSGVKSLIGAIALGAIAASPASAQSWSGIYIGAHGGYAWSDVNWSNLNDGTALTVLSTSGFTSPNQSYSLNSVIGGGQFGIQHQFGTWVLGGEISVSGGKKLKDRHPAAGPAGTFVAGNDDVAVETNISWLTLATARLGYSFGNWMAYAKAGYAGADVGTDLFDNVGPTSGNWTTSKWHNGWTLGAGAEFKWLQNAVVGLEYNYINLQSATHAGFDTQRNGIISAKVDPDAIHTVMARLSFLVGRAEARPEPLK